MIQIEIHEAACRGCRLCVEICPTEVLCFDEPLGKARVQQPADCIACLSCSYRCPSGALRHADYHVVRNFYRDLDFSERMERFL